MLSRISWSFARKALYKFVQLNPTDSFSHIFDGMRLIFLSFFLRVSHPILLSSGNICFTSSQVLAFTGSDLGNGRNPLGKAELNIRAGLSLSSFSKEVNAPSPLM